MYTAQKHAIAYMVILTDIHCTKACNSIHGHSDRCTLHKRIMYNTHTFAHMKQMQTNTHIHTITHKHTHTHTHIGFCIFFFMSEVFITSALCRMKREVMEQEADSSYKTLLSWPLFYNLFIFNKGCIEGTNYLCLMFVRVHFSFMFVYGLLL